MAGWQGVLAIQFGILKGAFNDPNADVTRAFHVGRIVAPMIFYRGIPS